jgi:uncharacterized protein (TIGR04255 family)
MQLASDMSPVRSMSKIPRAAIDLTDDFPHLSNAPIVEAVIHWQARAIKPWEPDQLRAAIEERLPEYPQVDAQHTMQLAFKAWIGETAKPPTAIHEKSWHGLRLTSADKHQVVQFTRDGLVFSRLKPYEEWDRFVSEAIRLWHLFVDLAAPDDVQRLGVRFINRIEDATHDKLDQFLKEPPSLTTDFPLTGFVYQSTLDVPGHDLSIRIVKAMPPANSRSAGDSGLIVDIDAFTTRPMLCEDVLIDGCLSKMHWLKNKVFFDLLTDSAVGSMR